MVNTIYIVPIEPIDARYTKQWYDNIPLLIEEKSSKYNVVTIDGEQTSAGTTTGAFLDFAVTNVYKSSQIVSISKMFNDGTIKAGDKFLVTDAWNYAIIAIRYMSELLNIPVEIHGIWHAGAYDPTDILGMKMSKPWPWHFEKSIYNATDYNYYATDFHKNMFLRNLEIEDHSKAYRSGQPHKALIDSITFSTDKQNIIMWPHRYNADKQPEIIENLKTEIDAQFVITQKMNLTKEDYYAMLQNTKIIFSCSLHENLGISMMEGVLAGCIPIVPDRASYHEMYLDEFKYPSQWTESYSAYEQHKDLLIEFILNRMNFYSTYENKLKEQKDILNKHYLNADVMINNLVR